MRNTKNYKVLPYNPELLTRARELRKAGNLCEALLWKQLHRGNFRGYDFDRQKIIGNYIVDFYCSQRKVIIEIDGVSHGKKREYDQCRDQYLQSLGLTVIHVLAEDVLKRLDEVMAMLSSHPVL